MRSKPRDRWAATCVLSQQKIFLFFAGFFARQSACLIRREAYVEIAGSGRSLSSTIAGVVNDLPRLWFFGCVAKGVGNLLSLPPRFSSFACRIVIERGTDDVQFWMLINALHSLPLDGPLSS